MLRGGVLADPSTHFIVVSTHDNDTHTINSFWTVFPASVWFEIYSGMNGIVYQIQYTISAQLVYGSVCTNSSLYL